MSTLSGSILGISLVGASDNGIGARKIYEIACSFTQTFTAGDVAQLVSVDTAVKTAVANGKTFTPVTTLVAPGMSFRPGSDSSGTAIYALGTFTNTSGTLTFCLGSTTTPAACTAPGSGSAVRLLVVGDES
jgi:hypothetical protein